MLEGHALRLGTLVGYDRVSIRVLPGKPGRTILHMADAWKPDMVAMASHGRSGLKGILNGSVSKHVASRFNGSVLVVRRLTSESARLESKSRTMRNHDQFEENVAFCLRGSTTNSLSSSLLN